MSEYAIKIHDLATNEIIQREMTPEEIEKFLATQADAQREQAETAAKLVQRQVILDRLGLTEEEAKLLLG